MKRHIKNWLGISELQGSVNRLEHVVSTHELRRMVGEAIAAALDGKPDQNSPWHPYVSTIATKNTLQHALERASVETARSVAKLAISDRIDGEAFIDDVVARIQRKQLGK